MCFDILYFFSKISRTITGNEEILDDSVNRSGFLENAILITSTPETSAIISSNTTESDNEELIIEEVHRANITHDMIDCNINDQLLNSTLGREIVNNPIELNFNDTITIDLLEADDNCMRMYNAFDPDNDLTYNK